MAIIETKETNGHSHEIDADEESGLTSVVDDHDHPYTIGDEQTREGGDDDHTHDIPRMNESLDESVVGGLVFNSRRDEQGYKRVREMLENSRNESIQEETISIFEAVKGKFTSAQMIALKKNFKEIKKINPSSKAFKGMTGMLDLMNDEQLNQIKDADINFLSNLALNRITPIDEDVATNFAGGEPNPNIDGLDEPFKKSAIVRRKKKQFGGNEVFEVDSETFSKCVKGKPKFARMKNFMSLDDFPNIGQDIREFAARNPKKAIILKDNRTGKMLFLKGKINEKN